MSGKYLEGDIWKVSGRSWEGVLELGSIDLSINFNQLIGINRGENIHIWTLSIEED